MCHHSLPSIITPMRGKESYKPAMATVYISIMLFYLALSYTGLFAFGADLNDLYTLNFLPNDNKRSRGDNGPFMLVIDYYLSLFPVFTISASFPIIGITLRNNLKSLYFFAASLRRGSDSAVADASTMANSRFFAIGLPLITLVPPFCIAMITHDLGLLVGITGSYAGVAIQYVVPSCLVYVARREAKRLFVAEEQQQHRPLIHSYASPFQHRFWVFFLLIWSTLSVIFVTINHIVSKD